MSFFISFGKINKQFYSLLFFLFISTLYYIPFISSFLYLPPLIVRIIESFSQTIIFIPYIIGKKIFFNKVEKNVLLNKFNQTIKLRFKDKIILLLIIILSLISTILSLFYNDIFKNYCYNRINIEIFLLVLLSKFIMRSRFYKHIIVSQIMLAIFSFANDAVSYFIFKEKISLNFKSIMIFFGILLIESLILSYKKYLIDKKYFSYHGVCSLFGLTNLIFTVILFIFIHFLKIKISLWNFDLNDIIKLEKEISLGITTTIILNIIYFFIFNYLYYNTLNDYTPIHVIFNQLFYIFISLLSIVNNKYLYLYIIFFIFHTISLLIYTEIIELNFCNLNKNLRRNIEIRGNKDYNDGFVETYDSENIYAYEGYLPMIEDQIEIGLI